MTALTTIVLAGCDDGHSTGETVYGGRFKVIGQFGDGYDILRDRETGCIYLEPTTQSGLTPLYDEHGKVEGCGNVKFDTNKYE